MRLPLAAAPVAYFLLLSGPAPAQEPLRFEFACVANIAADDTLTLREKPSADSGPIARLMPGSALHITGHVKNWVSVDVVSDKPNSGWVNVRFVEPVPDPALCGAGVAVELEEPPIKPERPTPSAEEPAAASGEALACVAVDDFLTLRDGPSADATDLEHLPDGLPLFVTGSRGSWLSVRLPDGDRPAGWVNSRFIDYVDDLASCAAKPSVVAEDPVPVQPEGGFACVAVAVDDFLALREKPSADGDEIDRLPASLPLRITGVSGNWVSVDSPLGSGWVNARFIERVENPASCGGETITADVKPDGDAPPDEEAACDEEAVLGPDGNVIFPAGATDMTAPEDVDEDLGLVSDLYPDLDTTTDAFYALLPCEPSIGGELPPEALEEPTPDEIEAEEYLQKFEAGPVEGIVGELALAPMPELPAIPEFTVGSCMINRKAFPCDSPQFLSAGLPFEGRDIIYVHGLAMPHITDLLNSVTSPAGAQWPHDATAFLDPGGYFWDYAEAVWRDHIRENLVDPVNLGSQVAGWQFTAADAAPVYVPKGNRFLRVAWSSNQTIEYAQHAMLTQIYLAITTNRNVVTPPTYPAGFVRPFCSNGCIVISHSTGGLVVTSALGLAMEGTFGPGARAIPERIRAHVALSSALSGSRVATVGVAIAMRAGPVPGLLCDAFDDFLGVNTCTINDLGVVRNGILRDLIPEVSQVVWGPDQGTRAGRSPVPTVTVAGGHPLGTGNGVTKIMLPGLDDGAVSMNSSCGNPNRVEPGTLAPSGAIVTSFAKAFDFSFDPGRLARAVKNFVSHRNLKMGQGGAPFADYLAAACTPYVSPTGMVMPIANPLSGSNLDARRRWPNVFSFIQGSLTHSYDGGGDAANPWPSSASMPAVWPRSYLQFLTINNEESSAVTDGNIFAQAADGTYLVKPIPTHETVRGRKVTFKLFGKRRTWWIWKRTYHWLERSDVKQSSHYVYEYVGRR